MNKNSFLFLFFGTVWVSQLSFSQTVENKKINPIVKKDTLISKKGKKNISKIPFFLTVGGLVSSFYEKKMSFWTTQPLQTQWRAGIYSTWKYDKKWKGRVDLGYISKGNIENFANAVSNTYILRYGQIDLFPLLYAPTLKKISPFIGAGGYFSTLLGSKVTFTQQNGSEIEASTISQALKKIDYGLVFILGATKGRFSLDLKYDFGINPILPDYAFKNRTMGLNVGLKLN